MFPYYSTNFTNNFCLFSIILSILHLFLFLFANYRPHIDVMLNRKDVLFYISEVEVATGHRSEIIPDIFHVCLFH